MQAAAHCQGTPANRHIPRSNREPISCISNRYTKLLEFGVTYTKQTTGTHSNRHKYALSFARHSTANFEKISALGAQPRRRNEVTVQ